MQMADKGEKLRPPECREGEIISRDPDGIHCTWRHYRLYYEDMA